MTKEYSHSLFPHFAIKRNPLIPLFSRFFGFELNEDAKCLLTINSPFPLIISILVLHFKTVLGDLNTEFLFAVYV